MTHSQFPAPSLTRNLHRADPQLLKKLFQPYIDAIDAFRPFLDYYEELGVRFPTPLERECRRATRAYFDKHASDFRPTWLKAANRTGQVGTRS